MLKSPGSSFSGVALFHTCLYLRFLLLVHHHLPLRDNLCVCGCPHVCVLTASLVNKTQLKV
jgi:hypothetical protein